MRLGDDDTEEMRIGRGVRQGCCQSLALFNLYAEKLTEKALEQQPFHNHQNVVF
ncbi:MAG: hypothetical protein ACEY3F_04890 [Wolbachia sp.]